MVGTLPSIRSASHPGPRFAAVDTAPSPTPSAVHDGVLLDGRAVIVTGAASGIGRALALAAAGAGAARIVCADRDEAGARATASAIGPVASAHGCDLGVEAEVAELVGIATEPGPIDVCFANAGIGLGIGPETPDADWDLIWRVNVMQSVWLARHLVDGWLAAGSGLLVVTASAAGLLTQIGSAPYAVTKHGAVAFAEWFEVTYGDRGVHAACLCPMGVNTPLLNSGGPENTGAETVRAAGVVLEPEQVAAEVLATIARGGFLVLPHPEVAELERRRTADRERWLNGMKRLQRRVVGG